MELAKNEITNDDFQKNADEVLLSRHVPPSVIVNAQMEIVQFAVQRAFGWKLLQENPT